VLKSVPCGGEADSDRTDARSMHFRGSRRSRPVRAREAEAVDSTAGRPVAPRQTMAGHSRERADERSAGASLRSGESRTSLFSSLASASSRRLRTGWRYPGTRRTRLGPRVTVRFLPDPGSGRRPKVGSKPSASRVSAWFSRGQRCARTAVGFPSMCRRATRKAARGESSACAPIQTKVYLSVC
jgi:hypothetical protein